ncbi:MAG: 7-cyano-7-deazaguanine synthase QueC [Desulfobacterales bacterium]|jgi:7-cyano-7-deazaguanine synthase|nr:7-cyano-7-deazaguanine synthase QueC [Desulfobacterales bacterium]
MKKAVVLSSGGIDSTTVMAIALSEGYDVSAISYAYGQRHAFELQAAESVAEFFKIKNRIVLSIDLSRFGGSALTDTIDVPKSATNIIKSNGIPVTYVPARNAVFLSLALAWAEVLGAYDIFIGVNAIDYSGYPDCRPEFIQAFEQMANLATRAGVEGPDRFRIQAPLLHMSKAQIIQKGIALGVDYSLTHSCYDPSDTGLACDRCDSCILRRLGFEAAGVKDPTRYHR